jgi:CRISPR/Cas system CMR-associated protein Cmr3 (group 5 of RAMP superfamily)
MSGSQWRLCRLEALDTIAVSDSRGLDDGGWAQGVAPSPLQLAGALRTAVLSQAGYDFSQQQQEEPAMAAASAVGVPGAGGEMSLRVAAPLRFRTTSDGVTKLLLPAPAICYREVWQRYTHLQAAAASRPGMLVDRGLAGHAVAVLTVNGEEIEPEQRWMSLERVCHLLGHHDADTPLTGVAVEPEELEQEERRHGHRRAASGVPEEKGLFSRPHLRFHESPSRRGLAGAGLAALVAGIDPWLAPGSEQMLRLGGDGHIARLRVAGDDDILAPAKRLAEQALDSIAELGGLQLYLATPAIFAHGWRPTLPPGLRLVAAAVGSPLTVSGWDLVSGKPRPLLRAAPAGSTYLIAVDDPAAGADLVAQHHLNRSLSDRYPELGFGLCLVGPWDARQWPAPAGTEEQGATPWQSRSSSCCIV